MASKKKQILVVSERKAMGSAPSRRNRKAGKIPAVVYGHGAEPRHFLLDEKEWNAVARQDVQIVELKQESGDNINVLIKEVQHNFLTGATQHVDFLEVKMDETITATVAVHGTGTPAGLSQGGMLEQEIHEIEISCTPLTLPETIEVDISGMELNDALHVGDLTLPDGVTLITDTDQLVFHVVQQKVEEEPEEGVEVGAEEEEAASEEGETSEEGSE